MLRSHGMVRECSDERFKQPYHQRHPDLSPDFIFAVPGFNVRSTEINAVLGRSQLQRLDPTTSCDGATWTCFSSRWIRPNTRPISPIEGSCNYAFTLVLREPDDALRDRVVAALRRCGVEFRRGTSGGGNQLRQPYLKARLGEHKYRECPNADHVHFYGFYLGNYPSLEEGKILQLTSVLNAL